jgi:hypothetical protein
LIIDIFAFMLLLAVFLLSFSYRQGHHVPQDAVRLLLWRLLDWYSQQFNSRWGFPTSCVLDPDNPARPARQDICNAIDSNHRYLVFFPEPLAKDVAKNYPHSVAFLATFYFAILAVMFSWKLESSIFVSFSLIFSIIIGLVHYKGRVNLPYILAKFQIIKADDVHHGTALLFSCSIVFRGLSSFVFFRH